jgi:hypothetical protein
MNTASENAAEVAAYQAKLNPLAPLIAEYNTYCNRNMLKLISADELEIELMIKRDEINENNATRAKVCEHIAWIRDFLMRWDEAEKIEAALRLKVRVIEIDSEGVGEMEMTVCQLHECFPDDSVAEIVAKAAEIEECGFIMEGGGAAPIFRLESTTVHDAGFAAREAGQ